jgi:hypothetical protein
MNELFHRMFFSMPLIALIAFAAPAESTHLWDGKYRPFRSIEGPYRDYYVSEDEPPEGEGLSLIGHEVLVVESRYGRKKSFRVTEATSSAFFDETMAPPTSVDSRGAARISFFDATRGISGFFQTGEE